MSAQGESVREEDAAGDTNPIGALHGDAPGDTNPIAAAVAAVEESGEAGAKNTNEVASGAPVETQQEDDVQFVPYKDETDMPGIVELIEKDLSEPYSVFTYRYFINNWPDLCFITRQEGRTVGAIVCKLDVHRCRQTHRGYIAMLAVDKSLRGKGMGSKLVRRCLDRMQELGADECVLEAEVTNKGALALYRSIGFIKEKRLHKYYLNGNDAFRLKFLFKLPEGFNKGLGCLGPPASDRDEEEQEAAGETAEGLEAPPPET